MAFIPIHAQQNYADAHQQGDKQQPNPTPFSGSQPTPDPEQGSTKNQNTETLCKRFIDAVISNWVFIAIAIPTLIAAFNTLAEIKKQGETMERQLKLEQRAWVGIKSINGVLALDNPFKIQIVLINSGKTPAKKVSTIHTAKSLYPGTDIVFDHDTSDTATQSVLIPGSEQFITFDVAGKISESDIRGIAERKYRYVLYGTITY